MRPVPYTKWFHKQMLACPIVHHENFIIWWSHWNPSAPYMYLSEYSRVTYDHSAQTKPGQTIGDSPWTSMFVTHPQLVQDHRQTPYISWDWRRINNEWLINAPILISTAVWLKLAHGWEITSHKTMYVVTSPCHNVREIMWLIKSPKVLTNSEYRSPNQHSLTWDLWRTMDNIAIWRVTSHV